MSVGCVGRLSILQDLDQTTYVTLAGSLNGGLKTAQTWQGKY